MSKPMQITLTREGVGWWTVETNRETTSMTMTAGDTAAIAVSDDVSIPGGSRVAKIDHETVGVLIRSDGVTIDVQTPETRARLEALKQEYLQRLARDRKRLSRRIGRLLSACLGLNRLRSYWWCLWHGYPFDEE